MNTPWEAKQHSAHSVGWYVLGSDGLVVAAGLTKENALFIAAASKMMEALRALVAAVEVHEWQGRLDDDPKFRAQAVIAEAEGKTT